MRLDGLEAFQGQYVYLVCSRAHAKGDCEYKAVPYGEVESAVIENGSALIDEAPRGAGTAEIESDIINAEEALSSLKDASKALTNDFVETRSPTLRARLRELAKEIEDGEQALTDLKEQRDRLSAPYLLRRIEALGEALKAEPFDVHQANLALRAVVSGVVLDVERSRITFHWRDTDQTSYLTVNTGKHSRLFDGVPSARDASQQGLDT